MMTIAARLTDRQKKKIIADYLELDSYNATAKLNGVSKDTVKRVVLGCEDIVPKMQQKKEENTADIFAYMKSKRDVTCEIIGKGLELLNDPDRLAEATLVQIATVIGILIDKWAIKDMVGTHDANRVEDDPITKSLKEESQNGSL